MAAVLARAMSHSSPGESRFLPTFSSRRDLNCDQLRHQRREVGRGRPIERSKEAWVCEHMLLPVEVNLCQRHGRRTRARYGCGLLTCTSRKDCQPVSRTADSVANRNARPTGTRRVGHISDAQEESLPRTGDTLLPSSDGPREHLLIRPHARAPASLRRQLR